MTKPMVAPPIRGGAEGVDLTLESPEVTTPWTREAVKTQIMAELANRDEPIECDEDKAGRLIDMYSRAVAHCRAHPGSHYYVSQSELDDLHYDGTMDAITPDSKKGVVDVKPGSAYAGLNSLLLTGSELAIEHTKAYDFGTHCTVTVQFDVV